MQFSHRRVDDEAAGYGVEPQLRVEIPCAPAHALLQETFEGAAAPTRERFPVGRPKRPSHRHRRLPEPGQEPDSTSWHRTCNQARSSASLLRQFAAANGRPSDARKYFFARPAGDRTTAV